MDGFSHSLHTETRNGNLTVTYRDPKTLKVSDISQAFDPLSELEKQALDDDIRARGIQVPVEIDQDDTILDGHHRVEIAIALGMQCPVTVHPYEKDEDKLEHAVKANLLRRHVSPLAWARAMQRLLDAKEIERNTKRNRFADRDDTVSRLYKDVGVDIRTAQRRFALFDALKEYPDLVRQVDTGEKSAAAAKREARQRQGTDKAEQPKKPGTLDDLTKYMQRYVGKYVERHENIFAQVYQQERQVIVAVLDEFEQVSQAQQESSEVIFDTHRAYKHEHGEECEENCALEYCGSDWEPIEEHYSLTRRELDGVCQFLLDLWRKKPTIYFWKDDLRKRPEFRLWCDDKQEKTFDALEKQEYFLDLGLGFSPRDGGRIRVLHTPEVIEYYRKHPDKLDEARKPFLQEFDMLVTEEKVLEAFKDGRAFCPADIIGAYPATTEKEAKELFDSLRKREDIEDERQGRGGKRYLRVVQDVQEAQANDLVAHAQHPIPE